MSGSDQASFIFNEIDEAVAALSSKQLAMSLVNAGCMTISCNAISLPPGSTRLG